MDDIAGHDAADALVGDVDDDVAGRMPDAGLEDDAGVKVIVVVDERHLLGFFDRQDAVLETDAMDARIAPSVGCVPELGIPCG